MYACDFEYDGQRLSDFGFILCDFDGASGVDVVSAGSQITFNTVSKHHGRVYSLTGAQYDECITSTFDICKDPDVYDDMRITNEEYRDVMRWLNRKEFLRFQMLDDDDASSVSCYYEASFNVSKIVVDKVLYGLELTMVTNKPFGYGEDVSVNWAVTSTSDKFVLTDVSDEIGYIYPTVKITCTQAGNLRLYNETTNCTVAINNVSVGEVITLDGDTFIVTSSLDSHVIYNDFNFQFLTIRNTYNNRDNVIAVSLPCKLEITYSPIIKDAPE